MKKHALIITIVLLAVSLSLISVPYSVQAANPNILYISPSTQATVAAGKLVPFQVRVSNMNPFNAWDISVKTDPSALSPASLTITPNTLTANFSLPLFTLSNCVNGGAGIPANSPGNMGCTAADGPGIAHSAAFGFGAPPAVPSVSGVLFTITYTAGSTGSSAVTLFNDVISASGVNVVHSDQNGAYGTIKPTSFTISVNPTAQSVVLSSTSPATQTLTSIVNVTGNAGSIALSSDVSPPGAGVTPSLNTTAISGSGFAKLSINVANNATSGQFAITVTGSSATAGTQQALVTLTITTTLPDFTITLNPNPLPAVLAGYNGTTTVTVTSLNNFAGTVSLSVASTPKGSILTTLSTSSVTLSANQSQTVNFFVQTFALTPVPARSPSGLYAGIVIGTSGSLTHSALAVITVTPAVFFLHLKWIHHFLYAKNSGFQTFTADVQNNSTSAVTAQVVVRVRCGGVIMFAISNPAGTILPGGNILLNQPGPIISMTFTTFNITRTPSGAFQFGTLPLPPNTVGDECVLRAALFYGASANANGAMKFVTIRRTSYPTNIVNLIGTSNVPLIGVNGKVKFSPSASLNFQFGHTLTGKFFVLP